VLIINLHGRAWDEFDSIRAQALIAGPFSLESEDGVALCGRYGASPERLTAKDWHRAD